ncbi:MAG: hypothetical protein B7Z08_06965 [Sphingomonadales bacterium 32-68-7]|nr:MAG: hypothetical protein B7Z33_03895 [Sphingomonadales bacterium 12-68-11]OYX08983.1 MAG: hypothetical protein B7Z08_06965 [Sphingomonadales bacterium 32-68-7]
MIDRRQILIGGAALGAATLFVPSLAAAQATGPKRLLFVLLRGAADGLGLLAPVGDPDFERQRGVLAEDFAGAPKIGGMFAFHPGLERTAAMFASGEALVAHAVASSYRERSHFDAQNLLETGGASAHALRDGWLNRLLGQLGTPRPTGLAIAPAIPLALRGALPVTNFAPSPLPDAAAPLLARVGELYAGDDQLHALWQQALATRAMAGDSAGGNLRNAEVAGTLAASLMSGPGGAGIAMLDLDGWDTHANQRGALARQLRQLDALLGAYRSGMGEAWGDTLVLVATEFGRTVRLNGTGGTDHGTAGAALVLGGAVRGGRVIADWPGLADAALHDGRDLRPTGSLEAVLAGAAAAHFALDPAPTMAALFPGRQHAAVPGLLKA